MSLMAFMMISASASENTVSTRMSRSSPETKKDLTIPLGPLMRHGTILMFSIVISFRMLTIDVPLSQQVGFCLFDSRHNIPIHLPTQYVAHLTIIEMLL